MKTKKREKLKTLKIYADIAYCQTVKLKNGTKFHTYKQGPWEPIQRITVCKWLQCKNEQIVKKKSCIRKKNKSEITRYKRIILYISFTLLTNLNTNNVLQTDKFSQKVKSGFMWKQLYVFCKIVLNLEISYNFFFSLSLSVCLSLSVSLSLYECTFVRHVCLSLSTRVVRKIEYNLD